MSLRLGLTFFLFAVASLVQSKVLAADEREILETPEIWGASGPWTIFVDGAEQGGCFMERKLSDGYVLRLGLTAISHEGYFVILNREWNNIEDSEVGDVYFDFGDEVFGGDAVSVVEGEYRGGMAMFNNPELLSALANRLTVVVSGSAKIGFEFTLKGTKLGIEETDRCRVAQRAR